MESEVLVILKTRIGVAESPFSIITDCSDVKPAGDIGSQPSTLSRASPMNSGKINFIIIIFCAFTILSQAASYYTAVEHIG